MSITVGQYVWLPCEVKPGAFSNERMVRVRSELGDWVGFVPAVYLRDAVSEGDTLVRALVVEVQADRVGTKLPGEALARTLSWNRLSQVTLDDPVEAGHPGVSR